MTENKESRCFSYVHFKYMYIYLYLFSHLSTYIFVDLFIVRTIPKTKRSIQKKTRSQDYYYLSNPMQHISYQSLPFQFHPYQSTPATQPATFVATLAHGVQTPLLTWNQYDESLDKPPGDPPGGEGILGLKVVRFWRVS